MAHPWFVGFNWDLLKEGHMQAPHVPSVRSPVEVAHPPPRRLHQDRVTFEYIDDNPEAPGFWHGW